MSRNGPRKPAVLARGVLVAPVTEPRREVSGGDVERARRLIVPLAEDARGERTQRVRALEVTSRCGPSAVSDDVLLLRLSRRAGILKLEEVHGEQVLVREPAVAI